MTRDLRRAPVPRCLLVWTAVTAAAVLLLHVLRSEVSAAPQLLSSPVAPDDALSAAAAVALVGCVLWLWLVTSVTALDAARGHAARSLTGCPVGVRRLVLAACGVALAASVAPAHADAPASGAGLPPQPVAATAGMAPTIEEVTVRSGDSLWQIASERLTTPGASAAEVDRAWRGLWSLNRDVVGDEPDLILPGQRLILPEAGR